MIFSQSGFLKRNNIFRYVYFKLFSPKLKFSNEDIDDYVIHYEENPAFIDYYTHEFEQPINNALNKFAGMVEFEYLLRFPKKSIIEPRYGWVITEGNKVYKRSLPYGIDEITPLPHYIFYKRKKIIHLKSAIPLYYNWFNYWHFYNDIIGQLYVLDKLGFDKNIPIIVPENALKLQYVRDFFETSFAKKWNWILLNSQTFVKCDEAFICKNFANVKEQFLFAKEIFKGEKWVGSDIRIFLNRHESKGRNIINIEEIIPILESFNFKIVDTEHYSIKQQQELFSSASVIMGIHGAGLTNMFFRYPNSCKIIEIFPKNHYPIHFYWLAKELKFNYTAISGDSNNNNSFLLDKEKLLQTLRKL